MRLKLSGPSVWKALVAMALMWVLRHWVWMPIIVVGSSMEPTLHPGQFAGVNKLAYLFRPPGRGEVVAVWTGRDLVIKRIVGLPEEDISDRDGFFYVNGARLPEPYVQFHGGSETAPGKIGPDCFVIAGDNRSETFIGVVRRSRIVGRVVVWRQI